MYPILSRQYAARGVWRLHTDMGPSDQPTVARDQVPRALAGVVQGRRTRHRVQLHKWAADDVRCTRGHTSAYVAGPGDGLRDPAASVAIQLHVGIARRTLSGERAREHRVRVGPGERARGGTVCVSAGDVVRHLFAERRVHRSWRVYLYHSQDALYTDKSLVLVSYTYIYVFFMRADSVLRRWQTTLTM